MIWEQFLELLETLAGGIGLGFDLYRKNIIFALNEEVYLIRRIALCPVPGNHFKLCDYCLLYTSRCV